MKSMWRSRAFHIGGIISLLYGIAVAVFVFQKIDDPGANFLLLALNPLAVTAAYPFILLLNVIIYNYTIYSYTEPNNITDFYFSVPVILFMNYLIGGLLCRGLVWLCTGRK